MIRLSFIVKELLNELDFATMNAYKDYRSQHEIQPKTIVTVNGQQMKAADADKQSGVGGNDVGGEKDQSTQFQTGQPNWDTLGITKEEYVSQFSKLSKEDLQVLGVNKIDGLVANRAINTFTDFFVDMDTFIGELKKDKELQPTVSKLMRSGMFEKKFLTDAPGSNSITRKENKKIRELLYKSSMIKKKFGEDTQTSSYEWLEQFRDSTFDEDTDDGFVNKMFVENAVQASAARMEKLRKENEEGFKKTMIVGDRYQASPLPEYLDSLGKSISELGLTANVRGPLFRGMKFSNDNFDSFVKPFLAQAGEEVDWMPASSFSHDQSVASSFAWGDTEGENSVVIRLHSEGNSVAGFDIQSMVKWTENYKANSGLKMRFGDEGLSDDELEIVVGPVKTLVQNVQVQTFPDGTRAAIIDIRQVKQMDEGKMNEADKKKALTFIKKKMQSTAMRKNKPPVKKSGKKK